MTYNDILSLNHLHPHGWGRLRKPTVMAAPNEHMPAIKLFDICLGLFFTFTPGKITGMNHCILHFDHLVMSPDQLRIHLLDVFKGAITKADDIGMAIMFIFCKEDHWQSCMLKLPPVHFNNIIGIRPTSRHIGLTAIAFNPYLKSA
jgi:hypothetical protein